MTTNRLPTAPGYNEYPPISDEEATKAPACVVSHPDAGGECHEPAVLEVWSLPFCARHGAEAKAGALEELAEDAENVLGTLVEAERARHATNLDLVRVLERAEIPGLALRDLGQTHDQALREAYPPLIGRVDSETTRYEYDWEGPGPYDWWTQTRGLLCKFMRQAHDGHHPELVEMLEPLRERAAAQQVHAEDDYERRFLAPERRKREEKAVK